MAKAKVKTKTLILPININTNFMITKTLLLISINSFNLKKHSTYFSCFFLYSSYTLTNFLSLI